MKCKKYILMQLSSILAQLSIYRFFHLKNFGLKNKGNGGCVESEHFWPDNGRHLLLRWTTNCDGDRGRSKLRFLETGNLLTFSA